MYERVGLLSVLAEGQNMGLRDMTEIHMQSHSIFRAMSRTMGIVAIVFFAMDVSAQMPQPGVPVPVKTPPMPDTVSLQSEINELRGRVEELERLLAGVTRQGADIVIDGANVHIRNGLGDTYKENGTGNLIIGYNKPMQDDRSGSHNLVIGDGHSYGGVGGLVVGHDNAIEGKASVVLGGGESKAKSDYSVVMGGFSNQTMGRGSVISGGLSNNTVGEFSSINGGALHTVECFGCTMGGGLFGELRSVPYDWSVVMRGEKCISLYPACLYQWSP